MTSPTIAHPRTCIKLLGAVSDSGETFFLPCAENVNSDTTICLLDALQTEFGEKSASSWPMRCRNSSKTRRSNCVTFRGAATPAKDILRAGLAFNTAPVS